MSTVDTSTWSPDTDRNNEIVGVSLSADASVSQTWLAIRALMAALKGDTSAIRSFLVPFTGATASADGAEGFVPAPEAGDESKVLQGDGTWGTVAAANHVHGNITNDGKLTTASRAVVTDGNKAIAVSSVTATELGYLSGVTSAVQTQLNGKASTAEATTSAAGLMSAADKAKMSLVGAVFAFRGRVAGTSSLPQSGNAAGDVYAVESPASVYAWDGSAWVDLGFGDALVPATSAEVDALFT